MEAHVTDLVEFAGLSMERLTEDYLDAAVELCDQCVGKNLYPRAYLTEVIDQPSHQFYLLVTPEREVMGYVYHCPTDLDGISALSKLPREQLAAIFTRENCVIGNLCSIGVAEVYRHHHLSTKLARFSLEQLQTVLKADAVFAVGWKIGDYVPVEKTLKSIGYIHLTDSHRVWYDKSDLVCPFCTGRCKCDAAIFYKPLKEGIIA